MKRACKLALLAAIFSSFYSTSARSQDDRDFLAKYFSTQGLILLPISGNYRAGDILDATNFRVIRKFDECKSDAQKSKKLSKRYTLDPKWKYQSVEWKGKINATIEKQSFDIDVRREDIVSDIHESGMDLVIEEVDISLFGAANDLQPDCLKYYFPNDKVAASDQDRNVIVLDKIAALKGSYETTTNLEFSANADVEFTLNEIIPFIRNVKWLNKILRRFDTKANASGSQLSSQSVLSRHNLGGDGYQMTYLAFRPRFINKSNAKKIRDLLENIEHDYNLFETKYESGVDRKTVSAAFLEAHPMYDTRSDDFVAAFLSGTPSNGWVNFRGEKYSENTELSIDSIGKSTLGRQFKNLNTTEIEPNLLESLSEVLRINLEGQTSGN